MQTLQKRLISSPILSLHFAKGLYIVDTDAWNKQVGAVLLQEQPEGSPALIGYWSKSLTQAKHSYNTTERECLAVVLALLLLRQYLEGNRYTVSSGTPVFDGF